MAERKRDPIRKVELADGRIRWRTVVDVGTKVKVNRATGKPVLDRDGRPVTMRDQRTITCDTQREAKAERAKILAARSTGTYVPPSKITLGEYLTEWLNGKRNIRASTRRAYDDNLKPVIERLGHVRLDALTKRHVDALVEWLLTDGRRVGNRHRKGVSPTTVARVLTVWGQATGAAVKEGRLARNVVALAERPTQPRREMATWTPEQARTFLGHVATDRLRHAYLMALLGLRRGEVVGLCWSDYDPAGQTLTIARARTSVAGVVACAQVKTAQSRRVLPLAGTGLAELLDTARLAQREEADTAGGAYNPTCPSCGGQHVVADELGQPVRPERFSDEFAAASRAAGVPPIRLHDARHTAATVMHTLGVPLAIISRWLGHARASFTLAVYTHSTTDGMAAAGKAYGAVLAGKEATTTHAA